MRTALVGAFLFLAVGIAGAQEVDREFGDVVRSLDDEGALQSAGNVQVQSATYEKVVYRTRRSKSDHEKSGAQMVSITYGDAPRVYAQGLQALGRQQWARAASDFDGAKNAVDAGKARPWLLEYAAVKKAEALRGQGRKDAGKIAEAIDEYRAALKANPKCLLFDRIQLGLASCYMLEERWGDAANSARALVDAGAAIKHPVWQAKGKKAHAEILVAQKKFADAVNAYQDLVLLAQRELKYAKGEKRQRELNGLEIGAAVEQGWARVARAETTGSQSDWDEAQRYFQGLGSRFPGNEWVAAAVLNGIGRCLLDKNPREALLKFVEAEVTHFTARAEVARALYLKARAHEKLGSSKMAELALKELREFYPDSEWARR